MINLNALPQRLRLTPAADGHEVFEQSYLEPGMLVNLLAVSRYSRYDNPESAGQEHCYELVLDAEPYYDLNLKLMREDYYPTIHTPKDTGRQLFTAVEAGFYNPQEKVYFCVSKESADPMAALLSEIDSLFETELPDSVATKEAHGRLLGSHQRLREQLLKLSGKDADEEILSLLDEAERIERDAQHDLG